MSLKTYTYVVLSGGEITYDLPGEGVSILEANLPIFEMSFDGSDFTQMQRGLEYRPASGFKSFSIRNTNSTGLTVTLAVFTGNFEDRRLLTNEVQGIEPLTFDGLRATSYTVFAAITPPAGNYGAVQVFNPAGSGKLLVVDKFEIFAAQPATIRIGSYDPTIGGTETFTKSLVIGDANGVTKIRSNGSVAGILPGERIWSSRVFPSIRDPIIFERPIFLLAGKAFVIQPLTQQVDMEVNVALMELDG